MFAKLKKKLVDEEGEGSLNRNFGPGGATPVSPSGRTNSARRESLQGRESDNDTAVRKPVTKEDLIAKLAQKNEQIKDLETKVVEYGVMLKDAMKMKDKVEGALEKQQDAALKRIQEMNEDYQGQRSRMTEMHAVEMKKQQEEYQAKMDSLTKTNNELKEKVLKLEENVFIKREENDEIKEFQTQEIAKVKHLFLNSQEELGKCQQKYAETNKQLQESLTSQESFQLELETTKKFLEKVTAERDELKHQKLDSADLVIRLEREKTTCAEQLVELRQEMAEKCGIVGKLEHKLNSLQDEYDSITHSNEVYRQKMAAEVEENQSTISHLQGRITTLEQRLQDSDLSGDEKLEAVKSERDQLELKLEEARQHLNDIKGTWSSKINSLEQQISHLNTKISEDSEELEAMKTRSKVMEENFEKQTEDLQGQLRLAEERALRNLELGNDKESKLETQKLHLELELQKSRKQIEKVKEEESEKSKQLQTKINALENQLTTLNTTRELEKSSAQQKGSQLENLQTEFLEKELEYENCITSLEKQNSTVKEHLQQKQSEVESLSKLLEEARTKTSTLEKQISENLESLQERLKTTEAQLFESNKEKEKLHSKNAHLMKEIQELLEKCQILQTEAHKLQLAKGDTLDQLQTSLREKQEQLEEYQERIRVFENQEEEKTRQLIQRSTSVHEGDLDNSEVSELKKLVEEYGDQLAEKNKTIKMQQQRLTDLKKTLQRELKVQTATEVDVMESREKERESLTRSSTVPTALNQTDGVIPPLPPAHGHILSTINFHEIQETNFQYLRHVMFKYMCSADTEAVQLVKAVATLLHFTKEEERLVKDTIVWKMSWFGSKPTPAKPLKFPYYR